jgi:hypothetical protein
MHAIRNGFAVSARALDFDTVLRIVGAEATSAGDLEPKEVPDEQSRWSQGK